MVAQKRRICVPVGHVHGKAVNSGWRSEEMARGMTAMTRSLSSPFLLIMVKQALVPEVHYRVVHDK